MKYLYLNLNLINPEEEEREKHTNIKDIKKDEKHRKEKIDKQEEDLL